LTLYPLVTWEQVKHIFPVVSGTIGGSDESSSSLRNVQDYKLKVLLDYFQFAMCFFSPQLGENKRIHLITAVVMTVCASFDEESKVLADEEINGSRILAKTHIDFLLKRKDKAICIVEARNNDILQCETQSLIACECLADVEDLATVYGITTNFEERWFLKNDGNQIVEAIVTIAIEHDMPTKESLRLLIDKICSTLA
jgi:hypothetical protein